MKHNIGKPNALAEDTQKMGWFGKVALLLMVIVPLAATVWGIVLLWNHLVNWKDLMILAIFYVATIWGVGVGFHRLLTHRSFETSAPVKLILLALGSMALQGSAIEWAATHLKHHAKSDKEGDPHSPINGFWRAHVGWLFRDNFARKDSSWAKPYGKDRVIRFADKTFLLWAVLGFIIPGLLGFMIGGNWGAFWTAVLWGGVIRLFLVDHVTWSVNSVCHTFGWRRFQSNDQSRNEPTVGLLGLGEGWHNNHHAFPQAAYHGMRWWQIDMSGYLIRLLKWTHLARNVKMPTKQEMEARRLRRPKKLPSSPTS